MLLAEASTSSSIGVTAWDLTAAFLQAPVDKVIYMEQPLGYRVCGEHGVKLVWRLKKSIYGCKQSSRMFHLQVKRVLDMIGAVQSTADECLFFCE